MARILLAEDDEGMRAATSALLTAAGYEVTQAADGGEALRLYRESPPDLLILDMKMPVKSGMDVLQEVRARDGVTPILFLTSCGEVPDRVRGLTAGADDYIVKPFAGEELLARVGAGLRRRVAAAASSERIAVGSHVFIPDELLLECADGTTEHLTPREADLLKCFVKYPGRAISRDRLLDMVWGHAQYNTRTLDQHISGLRRKLGVDGRRIETIIGVGFKLR